MSVQLNRFCLRNVDIGHTLASSCMIWFLTWSFLALSVIHRSILISATCNLFSPGHLQQVIVTPAVYSQRHRVIVTSAVHPPRHHVIYSRLLSIHLRLRRPLLLFPGTTISIIFLDKLSSSLLLICPYKLNRFCLRNVDIGHTVASSCMIWFLTWSFLVLHVIHRSILISATCNLFSSGHLQRVIVTPAVYSQRHRIIVTFAVHPPRHHVIVTPAVYPCTVLSKHLG